MSTYRAPVSDMRFTLEHVAGLNRVSALDEFSGVDPELLGGLLDEAGRFAAAVIAPLARVGDQVGSVRGDDGSVRTPPGYREAYARFVEAGWPAAAYPERWGGGGMPLAVGVALQEMVVSADMAFSLCPMLTYSANEMLLDHGSDEQKAMFLEKLIAGTWSGTMLLTESQAGSDVGALTTRAVRQSDGSYRLTGTKIFITWGEHDMTENIVHIVLARTPEAPAGTKGISCFIVPKFLVNADGSPGERNDVACVSIEHKLGIHGSPTCVISFGDRGDGATGYLVGEEDQGMRYMFTMMNNARLAVGLEGLAVSERAYQQAAGYARERLQGRAVGADRAQPSPIIEHPDVRRMLMVMRSRIEAMRGVMYRNALAIDLSKHHPDLAVRDREAEIAAIFTPVSKAWGTDTGVEVTSLGIQIHGGSGYVEETGAAQWWRDSRIAPIYEGTNGIQAIDLVQRKVPLRHGAAIFDLLSEASVDADSAPESLSDVARAVSAAVDAVHAATRYLLDSDTVEDALTGATAYLAMLGDLLGGWMLLRGAAAALGDPPGYDPRFLEDKVATARFFAEHLLSAVPARLAAVTAGAGSTFAIPVDSYPAS